MITKRKLNWKQKICRELERVERILPEPACMQDDWPEWARQVGVELARTILPGVNLAKLDDPSARELGRVVGHKMAALKAAEAIEDMPKDVEAAFERLLIAQWGEKSEEKVMEYVKLVGEKFIPAYLRSIKRARDLASQQSALEQSEFFKGYGETVGENPNARKNTTTDIYFFMLLYWKQIDRAMKLGTYSVSRFHNDLCRVFGAHLVGDKKRIEKLCERKGLHFRAPGRPSLPEKSDTTPA